MSSAVEVSRYATLPLGAEVTGIFHTGTDLFFNVQNPNKRNNGINKGTVGIVSNPDLELTVGIPRGLEMETVVVAGADYQVLGQSGDNGLGEISTSAGELMFTSQRPDFNAFVKTNDEGTSGYLFTNWESRPGGMSRLHIEKFNNTWHVNNIEMLDFSMVSGTWRNCFGTLSPWGTPISSEELYFDQTSDWFDLDSKRYKSSVLAMEEYLGKPANPYRIGWNVEITNPIDSPLPVKRTAMGRFSHENVAVMSDNKTVYQSDDGTNTAFFKFIADKPKDLTAGTLYAAKANQDGESFELSWVELGHATQEQVEGWIKEYDNGGYISDDEIADYAGGRAMDARAAFLESRKTAKALGATVEFRKMEGVLADPEGKYLYLAMAEVSKGMSDDKGDIRVAKNKCGILYRMKLTENFDVVRMDPWVVGGPYNSDTKLCDANNIASPDNIFPLSNGVVLIGEDTSKHLNNVLWVAK